MRVDLSATVKTRDGEDVGSVERVIIDPTTRDVVAFVVNTGSLIGRDVLVPLDEVVDTADEGDTVCLRIDKADLDTLRTYDPTEYVAPPMGVVPAGYAFIADGFLWPTTAGAVMDPTEGRTQLQDVASGAAVVDRDGDDLGIVDDVRLDAKTGDLCSFVLRVGSGLVTLFGGGETVEVPAEAIDRIEDGAVFLKHGKADLRPRHES
ncbi:MAG: PRC-barrel domain-containing protein [Chloroflexi bacterium]|nr:PRC-barrel domain-containing protein [Chloroflexota bacterium]